MVYIVGWMSIYSVLLVSRTGDSFGKVLPYLSFFILGAIVVFRGDVGTDTISYEMMIRDCTFTSLCSGGEPLFSYLALFLRYFFDSPFLVLRLISLLFVLLFAFAYWRSSGWFKVIIFIFYFPVYFYSFGMNTVRLGIALSLLLLSYQFYAEQRIKLSISIGLLAMGFHISSFFALLIFLGPQFFKISRMRFLFLICGVASFFFYFDDYFIDKIILYQKLASPRYLSGVSRIIIALPILWGAYVCIPDKTKRVRLILSYCTLLFITYVFGTFSMAGLRLLDLAVFTLPLVVCINFDKNEAAQGEKFTKFCLYSGLLGVIFVFRNFLHEYGQGESPFLPYEFFMSFW